jgi:hypothetical protein
MDSSKRTYYIARVLPTTRGAARESAMCRLWMDGIPSAEIGRRFGVTPSAVRDRAYRRGWPPRQPRHGRWRGVRPHLASAVRCPCGAALCFMVDRWTGRVVESCACGCAPRPVPRRRGAPDGIS